MGMTKIPIRIENGKKQNELTLDGTSKSKSRSLLIGVEDVPALS